MKVLGVVDIPITICRLELIHKFYVFKKLSQHVILGLDFLSSQGAKIDWGNGTLEIQQGMVTAPMYSSIPKSGLARIVNRITIEPKQVVIAKVKVSGNVHAGLSIIEPIKTLPTKHQLMGARCLGYVDKTETCVKLLNPTNVTILLKQNEPVARVEQLHTSDILGSVDNQDTASEVCKPVNLGTTGVEPQINTTTSDTEYINIAKSIGVSLDHSNLSESQKQQLLALIGRNRDVFATCTEELGSSNIYSHKIETGDAQPVHRRPYRASPQQKAEIERQVEDLEKHGIISQSKTLWQSPVVLVKKRTGDYRFAIDFRELNKVTQPMRWPITDFRDMIDTLGESKSSFFSVIDMAQGFFQIPLDPTTKHKTGFTCHMGVYSFNRLPFGLMNSPMAFSLVMNEVLRGINFKFALCYIDDVLIHSQSFDEHLNHLSQVFTRFREANLRLKPSKCCFAAKEVKYLGHRFSKDGMSVDQEKIEAVKSYPEPKSQREVRSFLGLCNYYRRFVKSFADIARPLNSTLCKNAKFEWTDECRDSFNTLKKALTEAPILVFPDFSKKFILYTDASIEAISYILGQKDSENREHVIAYGGRSLRPAERNWGISDLEGLALVEGIRYYRTYLADKEFDVYTDHQALTSLKTIQSPGRLGRWAIFLQGYNYNVVHKAGKLHSNADALSRRPYEQQEDKGETTAEADDLPIDPQVDVTDISPKCYTEYTFAFPSDTAVTVNTLDTHAQQDTLSEMIQAIDTYQSIAPAEHLLSTCNINMSEEGLRDTQQEDPDFKDMFQYLEHNKVPENRNAAGKVVAESQYYVIDNELLFHLYHPRSKGHKWQNVTKQLAVPLKLRDTVLKQYHDALTACHYGVERTYEAIRMKYFWPSMYRDIQMYVKTCEPCQQSKRYVHFRKAKLQPLPVGDVFSRVHMDVLGPLPQTEEGYKYILLLVDAFSGWCEAIPLKTLEARETAYKIYQEFICRMGCPTSVLSDRGSNFMSKVMQEMCSMFQITKLKTSSYHPATNSTVERMNSVILQKLRVYCNDKQAKWVDYLPSIMMSYRISPAVDSSQYSPYYVLFGRECRLPIDNLLLPGTQDKTVEEHLRQLTQNVQVCRELVKENRQAAQVKYKTQYDKVAKTPKYKVQDNVWVYSPVTPKGQSGKMIRRWIGPYYIAEKLSDVSYQLRDLRTHKAMKSTVHPNRLKPYFSPFERPTNVPVELATEPVENLEMELEDQSDQPTVSKHPTPTPESQEVKSDDWELEKIMKACRYRDRLMYQAKYKSLTAGNMKSVWVYENDIPEEMRKDFHIKYTFSGKRRKQVRENTASHM
ncbi:MAG: reverse transcriptase domain-containing protein [Sedimenticola sp.]